MIKFSIIEVPYNYNFDKECQHRQLNDITTVVIHHSAIEQRKNVTPIDIHKAHMRKGYCGIGYHFYITKEGYIYRGRPITYVGAHAKYHNYNSIGICFEGNFDIDYLTKEQKFSYQQLIAYLFQELPSITDVRLHRELNATVCPGKNITIDKLTDCVEVYKKMIIDVNEAVTILKNKLLLEEQTINFLQCYKYGEQLILKIANAVKE